MSSLGGYFGLELGNSQTSSYSNFIFLNTGRNSLEFILKENTFKKIYIAYYSCNVILQPLEKLNIPYEYYSLDENFLPKISPVEDDEVLLYINYFGIMQEQVKILDKRFQNLIIDNSQAFFSEPIPNHPSFYSPRKFFGIPDGGLAYLPYAVDINSLKADISIDRTSHLLKRLEFDVESGYQDFKANEAILDNLPILKMSNLTKSLFLNLDLEPKRKIRNKNFNFLHSLLGEKNELSHLIDKAEIKGPMVYPFLIASGTELKKELIKVKIYVATYWPNVEENVSINSFEYYLFSNLVALPIDQRINKDDLIRINTFIQNFYNGK